MNTKVIVDAGHGGNDPGAVNGNIKEKDLRICRSSSMRQPMVAADVTAIATGIVMAIVTVHIVMFMVLIKSNSF